MEPTITPAQAPTRTCRADQGVVAVRDACVLGGSAEVRRPRTWLPAHAGSSTDGGGCNACPFTQSCRPGYTCDDGRRRRVAFCDSDCAQGECCHESLRPLGSTLCGAC